MHPEAFVVVPLGLLGLAISAYMAALGAGAWRGEGPNWLPQFCRFDEKSCAAVLGSRWARVFGVPNSWLGMVWFGLVSFAPLLHVQLMGATMLALSVASVVFSLVLAGALVWSVRVPCVLCFTSHGLNVLVLTAWVWVVSA